MGLETRPIHIGSGEAGHNISMGSRREINFFLNLKPPLELVMDDTRIYGHFFMSEVDIDPDDLPSTDSSPEELLSMKMLNESVENTLSSGYLSEREEYVLRERHGVNSDSMMGERTLKCISEDLGVNPERVRQIEAKASRVVRHYDKLPSTSFGLGRGGHYDSMRD